MMFETRTFGMNNEPKASKCCMQIIEHKVYRTHMLKRNIHEASRTVSLVQEERLPPPTEPHPSPRHAISYQDTIVVSCFVVGLILPYLESTSMNIRFLYITANGKCKFRRMSCVVVHSPGRHTLCSTGRRRWRTGNCSKTTSPESSGSLRRDWP